MPQTQLEIENGCTVILDSQQESKVLFSGQSKLILFSNAFGARTTRVVQQLAGELKGMAGALREVNASLNAPEISALVEDLENSFEGIEMTTDMMDEDFENMMSLDVDETEVDKIMGEIGTEIGLGAETGLPTPDIRSTELAKEIEKLREDKE